MSVPKFPDLEQLIAELSDPSAYPHPVDNVKVIQTHISCVFLTGDFAYKLKKPVDFGFLDYTTRESRHEFCTWEITLNRRLCPYLYIETVPITRQNGRLKVGGTGDCVDWAVKMRQLQAADMLAARLEAGSAGEEEIRRIALLLARFHAGADNTPAVRAWGEPDIIAGTIGRTLDTMDSLTGDHLSSQSREAIRRSLESFQTEEKGLLRERMQAGFTRDCHGDLRIQNICLDSRFDEGIQIFDCIEFNQEFRYIDVAADIAYLAMDLDLTGRADLREILVDSYRQTCGDHSLMAVLRFYQTYRACVRGNIALLAAQEIEIEEGQREAHRDMAAAAYDLARCYIRKPSGPAMFITVGFSGSGKTVLAREVARRLPAVLLSSDRIRKEMAGVAETAVLPDAAYSSERRAAVYTELCRRAAGHLARGEHVILDATFLAEQEREEARQAARKYGAEFWILECECPDSIIRERLAARQQLAAASDADITIYEKQLTSHEPVLPPAGAKRNPRHLRINTALPARETAQTVTDHFSDFP